VNLAPAVEAGIAVVRDHFADHDIELIPDGSGGAFVIVDQVSLGDTYVPNETWLGFHVNAAYPHSDVYPHYISRIERSDKSPHGEGIQQVEWQNRAALQLSRKSNGWSPKTDNAALKAEKVIAWLKSL
jgi:hypothetical protein